MNVTDALALVDAGQAVLCDARDRRLYENLHAAGALSVPLAAIESAHGEATLPALPRDRILIFYCA